MTADKHGRSTSPIHVHVEDNSPVHVHVKKPKKPMSKERYESKLTEEKSGFGSKSNLRRGGPQSRSKSPSGRKSPWIPPPGRASLGLGTSGQKLAWQGPSHRLELCADDLIADDTDEEERNTSKMRKYEKKIDTLMTEVGTLRNEVELQRSNKELLRREEDLEDTERALADKEAELNTYREELEATEAQNRILKRSMDYLKEDSMLTRSERERLNTEREVLMKKLVEVELDGQAAAKQVAALRDVIRRLREKEERLAVLEDEQSKCHARTASHLCNPLLPCHGHYTSSPLSSPPKPPDDILRKSSRLPAPRVPPPAPHVPPPAPPPPHPQNVTPPILCEPSYRYYDKWKAKPLNQRKTNVTNGRSTKKSLRSSRGHVAPARRPKLSQRAKSVEDGVHISDWHHPNGTTVRDIRRSSGSSPVLHQTLQIFTVDPNSGTQKGNEQIEGKDTLKHPNQGTDMDCSDGASENESEAIESESEATENIPRTQSSVKEKKSQKVKIPDAPDKELGPANPSAAFHFEAGKPRSPPVREEPVTDVYPRDVIKRRVHHQYSDTVPAKSATRSVPHMKQASSELSARSYQRRWSDSHVSRQASGQRPTSSVQNVRSVPTVASCTRQCNNNNKDNGGKGEVLSNRQTRSAPGRVVIPPELVESDEEEEISFIDSSSQFCSSCAKGSKESEVIREQVFPHNIPGHDQPNRSSPNESPPNFSFNPFNAMNQQAPDPLLLSPGAERARSPFQYDPPPPPPCSPQSTCNNNKTSPQYSQRRLYEQLSQRLQSNGLRNDDSQESERLLQLQSLLCEHLRHALKSQKSFTCLETLSYPRSTAQNSSHYFSPLRPNQYQNQQTKVTSRSPSPKQQRAASSKAHSIANASTLTNFTTTDLLAPRLHPDPVFSSSKPDQALNLELLRVLTTQYMKKEQPAAENHIKLSNTVNIPPAALAAAATTEAQALPRDPYPISPRHQAHHVENHMSSTDAAVLSKQKELLGERLADFEETNRALRQLLRERHEDETANLRLTEQRDTLLRKLKETEDRMLSLRTEIVEKDRLLAEARFQADTQKHENSTLAGLQGSLESTRAHLQKQLRQKEADCNRMAVQIRSLESQLAQERIEVDHLQQLLSAAKQKSDQDKEALKKATRVQKQRASRSEDAVEQLQAQLMERDQRLADVNMDLDALRPRLDKISKEKAQSQAENSALKTRLAELEAILERVEDDNRATIESANSRIQEKSAEATTYSMDNERLKNSLASTEDKVLGLEEEMSQLRAKLRHSETLVEEYRDQMNKSRREADQTIMQLEEAKRETDRVVHEGESELDKVKSRLQSRLTELEPIPALLQTTELRLADTTERLQLAERRHIDNTRLIAELTAKIESQSQQVGTYREKITRTTETNRSLEGKLESVEKKLRDIEDQNRDLLQTISKKEEAMHQSLVKLDERGHENASLQRQLETALADARRMTDSSRDKAACKERTWQQRILDLEAQLSAARTENARVKREKDEAERKFNSRLYDLRDRLEQSHATNRSMQNYVHFLKTSYANVFGDTAAASPFGATSPMKGSGGASFHTGI